MYAGSDQNIFQGPPEHPVEGDSGTFRDPEFPRQLFSGHDDLEGQAQRGVHGGERAGKAGYDIDGGGHDRLHRRL